MDSLARFADRRAKVVVAVTAVFFLVAAYFGGNVAEYMGPYGDADPADVAKLGGIGHGGDGTFVRIEDFKVDDAMAG